MHPHFLKHTMLGGSGERLNALKPLTKRHHFHSTVLFLRVNEEPLKFDFHPLFALPHNIATSYSIKVFSLSFSKLLHFELSNR